MTSCRARTPPEANRRSENPARLHIYRPPIPLRALETVVQHCALSSAASWAQCRAAFSYQRISSTCNNWQPAKGEGEAAPRRTLVNMAKRCSPPFSGAKRRRKNRNESCFFNFWRSRSQTLVLSLARVFPRHVGDEHPAMVSVSRALTALLILALVCASSGDPDSAGTTESCTDKGEGGCSPDAAPSPPSNPSPPAPPSAEKAEPPSPPAAEKAEPPSAEKAETASDPVPSTENSQDCPSCYGAEDPARGLRCCKTCREVDPSTRFRARSRLRRGLTLHFFRSGAILGFWCFGLEFGSKLHPPTKTRRGGDDGP